MWITITSNKNSFRDVGLAKRMITKSLMQFLGDKNAERRLTYELALTAPAEGSYNFPRSGSAIKQECHKTTKQIWMKVIELSSAKSSYSDKISPHGMYLLNQLDRLTYPTDCSIEVYGCKTFHANTIPKYCGPYVFVCGNESADVKQVTNRVISKIREHMAGCSAKCSFR